jgi:hypothetical protein
MLESSFLVRTQLQGFPRAWLKWKELNLEQGEQAVNSGEICFANWRVANLLPVEFDRCY